MTMKRNGAAKKRPTPVPDYWQRERDWAYSASVYPKLARKYPNQWIAVAHHRVLAAGTNLQKVLVQAQKKVAWEEIPLVFVERGMHVYVVNDR